MLVATAKTDALKQEDISRGISLCRYVPLLSRMYIFIVADNASSPSKFGGLWGELFYGIDWKGINFSFDNILCTDYYVDALTTLGGSSGGSDGTVDMERHINYSAGYALFKFLFWSVVNGWDMEWRHSQDSSFKIDTVKAI